MMKFLIEQRVTANGDLRDFDERTDRLQDELLKLAAIEDPDMLVNLRSGEVEVSMIVEQSDGDPIAATIVAATALRTAIHAIGDGTPNWERYFGGLKTDTTALDYSVC